MPSEFFWPPDNANPYPISTDNDPRVNVGDTGITIKFQQTLNYQSVLNAQITLSTNASSPVILTNGFLPISLANYDSIGRVLTLYFNVGLQPSTSYTVAISGLKDAAGNTLSTVTYNFTTNSTAVLTQAPYDEAIYIEDHSIRTDAFTNFDTVIKVDPNFYIVSTDPDLETVIIGNAYNNGRITIMFNVAPNTAFLNLNYFKVQYKPIQRGLGNMIWSIVPNVLISLDSQKPSVYLDLPSQDATPVYNTPGSIYYLDTYKYRIRVSAAVGT